MRGMLSRATERDLSNDDGAWPGKRLHTRYVFIHGLFPASKWFPGSLILCMLEGYHYRGGDNYSYHLSNAYYIPAALHILYHIILSAKQTLLSTCYREEN